MTATVPTLDESIERMKNEILEDIKAGRVPADCPSFSALHDHVDANCYGGFCEDELMQALTDHFGGRDDNEGMPDGLVEYLNDAQNSIDRWIKDGGAMSLSLSGGFKGNVAVGKAFDAIIDGIGRGDIGEILMNWNDSQLNEDGDKIICYPGRDGRFSLGKEGGKVIISKREFLTWLMSDEPFDEKVYGANIRNNPDWTALIRRAREAAIGTR